MSPSKSGSRGVAEGECTSPRGVTDLHELVHNFESIKNKRVHEGSSSGSGESNGFKSKTNSKMREKREQRRAAAANRGGGSRVSLPSVNEQRVKNRASVEKCRAKKRERVDNLQAEQEELAKENERMRRVLQMVESTSIRVSEGR